MVESFGDHTGNTGIDDGRGAPGLAHQNISYEFSHDRDSLEMKRNGSKQRERARKRSVRSGCKLKFPNIVALRGEGEL
jgi:hypothetical protein